MNAGPIEILSKVDTRRIFRSWLKDGSLDNGTEPKEGWHVKSCKVYENDEAVVLFENRGDDAYYYRWRYPFLKLIYVPRQFPIDLFSSFS